MRRTSAAAVVAAALTTAALAASAGAAPRLVQRAGSQPAWARAATASAAVPAGAVLDVSVQLALRDAAGAEAYALAVSDPASRLHGRFLTPAQYRARFAASDATVARVRNWLTHSGLTVTASSPTNRSIGVRGTVAQLERAFSTRLVSYRHAGTLLRAPSRPISLPGSVAGAIAGVSGLTQSLARRASAADAPPPPAFVNAPPCSSYFGEKLATSLPRVAGAVVPYAPCGYVPQQLRDAYGVSDLGSRADGRGVTVAVVDAYAAPTILADANTYARRHGDDAFGRGQFSQIVQRPQRLGFDDTVNGDLCGEQGWYGEETLDVEAVHGMAPGANVLYVGGRSCDDFDLNAAVQTIVDRHLADVVTNSYGDIGEDLPADDIAANHATFVQAAVEGIGLLFSSGDDGDEIVIDGARQVDFPASDPFVTAVGGTAIGIGRRGERLFETAWQSGTSTLTGGAWTPAPPGDFLYGGGGGESQLFREPAYQRGVVPRSIAQYFPGPAGRAVPDVAAVGDPQTGMLIGETQTFANGSVRYSEYRIGGTSLSSPVMAGVMALVDQARGRPLGFANPALYALAGSRAYHDIAGNGLRYVVRVNFVNSEDASDGTTTILRSMNYPQTIFVRPGYDDVTGLGTPDAPAFVRGLGG